MKKVIGFINREFLLLAATDCDMTLSGISQDCYGSIGGLNQIWLGDRSKVTPVANVEDDGTLSGLTGTATPQRYFFKKESASMVTNGTDNRSFITVLTASFDKIDGLKYKEWVELSKDKAYGLVKDANGIWWFLGFDNPLEIDNPTSEGTTGSAREDDNMWTVVLQDYSRRPPYEVPAELAEALINGKANVSQASMLASLDAVMQSQSSQASETSKSKK